MGKFITLLTCLLVSGSVLALDDRKIQEPIRKVIARVGEVWDKSTSGYETFHKQLSQNYSGTPNLTTFLEEDQWVVVKSSNSFMVPGLFKGHSAVTMNLKVGDIVEMTVSDYQLVKLYSGLNTVTKVICKFDTSEYAECIQRNPLSWYDQDGKVIEQQP
jgi:hypothetical protein